MLKKAMYFLFGLSFLAAFNGYANEEVAENTEVEISANEVESAAAEVEVEVADNANDSDQECTDCGASK